ncbi:MAG TPA: ATP-binding protein, partial [Anaerolineales bacterium]|nr:ATP-binding protein [Anaerolineales bacterium]
NVARAQALADFSQALAEAREDYRPGFEYIVRKVSTLIGDTCNISLVSKDGKYLENVAVYHPDPQHLTLIQNLITSINYPLGEGLTGKVAAEGTPILIPTIPQDVLRTQIKPEFHPILEQYGMSSLMIVPMSVRDHIVGIMGVARDRAGAPYSTEEFTFLQDLANRLALAFENIQLFKEALTARHEAEQANQAKSEFLSRISHELRTPLNAILGFAQILSLDELSKGQTRAIQHILTAGKHLLNLINEVLDITRIEAGKLAISPEPIRVKEVVQETFDIVEALASEYQVNLSCSVAPFYYAKADRQRLKQALLNLVTNAIKYNTVNGFVWVKCTSLTEDRLRITVQDTGPGISSELQKRLFIPFDRLGAEKTNVEGTGLGLALSRRLIEAMGGQLGIESELGKGSTFWIELTMEENPLEQSYHPEDGLIHLSPVKAQAKPYQVLYIEDNLSNLQLLEEVFKHRPAVNLLAALDGKTGLEAARQHPLDAILLDLNLPDIPGHEIVLHLKADPKTAQIPIVIISADATVYQQQHLLDIGVYQFLTKPLEIGLFLETIDKILQNPSASPPS